jgi:hypothetical protein
MRDFLTYLAMYFGISLLTAVVVAIVGVLRRTRRRANLVAACLAAVLVGSFWFHLLRRGGDGSSSWIPTVIFYGVAALCGLVGFGIVEGVTWSIGRMSRSFR